MIDIGAGDGDKSIKLIETACELKKKAEYIPIDFQHETILALAEKLKSFENKLPLTMLTAKFEDGI